MLQDITPHTLIVGGSPLQVQAAMAPVLSDRLPGTGAPGGLYTALVEAPTEQVLVVACDMPFLTAPGFERTARHDRVQSNKRQSHDSNHQPRIANH